MPPRLGSDADAGDGCAWHLQGTHRRKYHSTRQDTLSASLAGTYWGKIRQGEIGKSNSIQELVVNTSKFGSAYLRHANTFSLLLIHEGERSFSSRSAGKKKIGHKEIGIFWPKSLKMWAANWSFFLPIFSQKIVPLHTPPIANIKVNSLLLDLWNPVFDETAY